MTPRPTTRSLVALGPLRLVGVALALLLGTSACSVVSSTGATTAALLGAEIGSFVERVGANPIALQPVAVHPIALQPSPRPGAFSMDLYEDGDFMHQQTKFWCVAASVQTMMNIVDDGRPNRSKAYQRRLHLQARSLDPDEDWSGVGPPEKHGLGLTHWVGLLNTNGYGPYGIDRAPNRRQAIRKAVKAMRLTGKPVGLVMWRGAHAWVMSGFTASADPAYTNDFRVRTVDIEDPWYPSVSSIWGRSRPPDSAVPVAALAEDYLRYNRPGRRNPLRDGKFMLILPTLPTPPPLPTLPPLP